MTRFRSASSVPLALLLGAAACGGSQAAAPAVSAHPAVAPCAGDSTVYAAADTTRGLRRARVRGRARPRTPAPGEWHARFIIGADGVVEPESIAIWKNGRPTAHSGFRQSIARVRWEPARLGGCAVRYAETMTVVHAIEAWPRPAGRRP